MRASAFELRSKICAMNAYSLLPVVSYNMQAALRITLVPRAAQVPKLVKVRGKDVHSGTSPKNQYSSENWGST
jgi:hypothetical protein